MDYLYHIVPPNLVGTELVPLHELGNINYQLYLHFLKKYAGREHVMEQRIPHPLNCRWNDVLFFTAVNPQTLLEAFEKAGLTLKKRKFYRFDLQSFNTSQMMVLLWGDGKMPDKYFTSYRHESFDVYSRIPKRAIEYYQKQAKTGLPTFLFNYVPHILFKGRIDVRDAEKIEV